jgi:hypothetical protein
MAAMAMVQAQNAKDIGGKFPKKKGNFQLYFQHAISRRKMTLEGSTWAHNVPTNNLKRHDSTDVSVQSVAHAPHCTWKS